MFSPLVIQNLGYYVYFLVDPRTDEIFYVGKGVGNRLFYHLACATGSVRPSDKLDRIRQVAKSGLEVKHYVLRHGLKESTAFELEAAMIDFLGMENLTNIVGGHYSTDFGLKTAEELTAMYEPTRLETEYPIILLNIGKKYRRDMTMDELYQITRQPWSVGPRRENVVFAVAVYGGMTREVYTVNKWVPVKDRKKRRWGFKGVVAPKRYRSQLLHKSVKFYYPRGATNPIKYVNC